MCQSQSDGGRRCAAHTRPAYRAAIDAILDEPDFAKKTALLAEHRDAVIAFAATPTGGQDFHIEGTALLGDAHREMGRQVPLASRVAAAEFEAAMRLTQEQAKVRTQVDAEVLRTLKYARTGTHAGAEVPQCVSFKRDSAGLTIDPAEYATAMARGRYDTGTAETVDWCDEAQAHHGFARVHAPWRNDLECLHCTDGQIGRDDFSTHSGPAAGANVNQHGYDMTPGQAPTLTRM